MSPWIRNFHRFIKLKVQIMTNNIEIVNAAVVVIKKVILLAISESEYFLKTKCPIKS